VSTILPIPGYLGYYASDEGRIYSRRRRAPGFHLSADMHEIHQGKQGTAKHFAVRLGGVHRLVYQLILETFVGPCPDGMECIREDDDVSNNRLSNLRWGVPDCSDIPELSPIPGCEGYCASRDGRIWSYRRTGPNMPLRNKPVILAAQPRYHETGALQSMMVIVLVNGRRKWRSVHWLMLTTFVGECPAGMEGCHWDHNPANNAIDNLRWDTHANNGLDRTRRMREEQRSYVGHKLTREEVLEIKHFLSLGHSCASLGRTYGVTTENIWSIKAGKTWKWVSQESRISSDDSPRITD